LLDNKQLIEDRSSFFVLRSSFFVLRSSFFVLRSSFFVLRSLYAVLNSVTPPFSLKRHFVSARTAQGAAPLAPVLWAGDAMR
jgi:hypothetical protein